MSRLVPTFDTAEVIKAVAWKVAAVFSFIGLLYVPTLFMPGNEGGWGWITWVLGYLCGLFMPMVQEWNPMKARDD